MDTRCKNRFVATTKEKWDLNQYWYSANTIASLKKEVQEHATKVAFLSTPSVWFSLENSDIKNRSFFFDVDSQWEKHSNFVYWNYNQPSEVDRTMHHQFDCVVIDPPFVTREVWAKYSEAALLLLKEGGKIILSTIPENAEMLKHMLNVKRQAFQPSIPHLVYQYAFFTNYESANFSFPNPESIAEFTITCRELHVSPYSPKSWSE
ncbi:uncharacterized protein [Physcomitrium patens]|uniref:uncharacterized protein isoform X3 n=1 Tax=Physcomitrium patens TaxID=3218 RepID=UPI003CCCBE64